MDTRSAGIVVVVVGIFVVGVGVLIAAGALAWVGRLPGDVRWESGNNRVYVPFTTMILASVVLSLLAFFARRFL